MAWLLRRAWFAHGFVVLSACASPTNDFPSGSSAADPGVTNSGGASGGTGIGGTGIGGAIDGAGTFSAGGSELGMGGAGTAAGSTGMSGTAGTMASAAGAAAGASGTTSTAGGGGTAGNAGSAGKGGSSGSAGTSGTAGKAGASGSGGTSAGGGGANGGSGGCEQSQTLDALADANINGAAPTTNYGPVAEANVVGSGPANSERELIAFDLSTLPVGATLKSAQLELTIVNNPGLDKTIAVHRVAQAWIEAQVTWQEFKTGSAWTTAGGDFVAQATDSQAVSGSAAAGSAVVFNVLADAQSFYATPGTNYGWLIKDTLEPGAGSGEHVFFATREHATPDYHPKLVVSYCP